MEKKMTAKIEKLLKEMNKKLDSLILYFVLKEDSTENKIKILCRAGLKSEEIGKIVGMTGRGVRKNKFYSE